MNLRALFLLTQCICFKTNLGSLELQSNSGETVNSIECQSKIEESVKADFFPGRLVQRPQVYEDKQSKKNTHWHQYEDNKGHQ